MFCVALMLVTSIVAGCASAEPGDLAPSLKDRRFAALPPPTTSTARPAVPQSSMAKPADAPALTLAPPLQSVVPTDDEIITQIIAKSRVPYTRNCACPYDFVPRNDSLCGERSAYHRRTADQGPPRPKCYPSDVDGQDLVGYRAANPS
jgi:hypothetical protein